MRRTRLMTNTDTRNSRDGMSQTTRSSFTPLPLMNNSQKHNYEVIMQNNRFSLSTFHACLTVGGLGGGGGFLHRFTTTPISPFSPLLTPCTPQTRTPTQAQLKKNTPVYAKGYSCEHALTRTQSHAPPSQSSS